MEGGEAGRFLGRIEGIGWLLRKNRIENGSRADPSGSNPHSYGDSFSVSGAIWASQKFIVVIGEVWCPAWMFCLVGSSYQSSFVPHKETGELRVCVESA